MSERHFSGFVEIEDEGPTGMITLRADLSDGEVVAALNAAGVEVPGQGEVRGNCVWMSPDEVMVLTDHDTAEAQCGGLVAAIEGTHSLVVNVSDARCVFRVTGADALVREVLAKLSPADLRASALPVGRVRRTRLAQVPAAFWFEAEGAARLICFRSVSGYVFGLLSNAAAEGSAVGHF